LYEAQSALPVAHPQHFHVSVTSFFNHYGGALSQLKTLLDLLLEEHHYGIRDLQLCLKHGSKVRQGHACGLYQPH
jgi:hypothetical protein